MDKNNGATADKTEVFTSLRPLLHSLAYQMLGNASDAEDMVQESFLRWQRAVFEEVRSPKAFLTTIITRLCLTHLQSARVQRERTFSPGITDTLLQDHVFDPADHLRLADSLSLALLVMLETLSPVERAIFLLRDVLDCDYDEIAGMVDKSEENCRQILRRARERLALRRSRFEVVPMEQERLLQQFLRASASGNWDELMSVLAEDVTLVCDGNDLSVAAAAPVRGASAVAESTLAKVSRWWPPDALLQTIRFHGHPVVLAYNGGAPVSALFVSIADDQIRHFCVVTCPVRLRSFQQTLSAAAFNTTTTG
jgi:RNA polymerase sigma-70 factor (ECF subfamily)